MHQVPLEREMEERGRRPSSFLFGFVCFWEVVGLCVVAMEEEQQQQLSPPPPSSSPRDAPTLARQNPSAPLLSPPRDALPDSSSASPTALQRAQLLFDCGCDAIGNDDYDQAVECFSMALEIRVGHYGELAPECALTYCKYGCALLYKAQAESDALNAPRSPKVNGEPLDSESKKEKVEQDVEESRDEDDAGEGGDGDLEGDDESDLDLSWTMLDIARVIFEKQEGHCIQEVDVITALADISLEREDFEMCFLDYTRALKILEELVEPDSRRIAELCFKLCLAQQLCYKPKDALKYCQKAVSVCEARLRRLKNEVPILNQTQEGKGKSVLLDNAIDETENAMEQKPLIAKEGTTTPQGNLLTTCKEEEEIKEIEMLLEDLRDKVVELEQMATGPSILEAFKMANPAAVNTIKEVLSASTQIGSADAQTKNISQAGNSSSSFDAPSCQSVPNALVTNLGVVGRGIKRAAPVPVASVANGNESQSKRRTLDDMMTGGGSGQTQIGFGFDPVVPNGGC
eukprot:c21592_g1_i1 orf=89-1633(+)